MKFYFFILFFFAGVSILHAQQQITIAVRQQKDSLPITGASVRLMPANRSAITDSNGICRFYDLAPGSYRLIVSHVGFEEQLYKLEIPSQSAADVQVFMEEAVEEEDEVIVVSTRTSTSIRNIPSRVETISGEELEEKSNMKPGELRMTLNESTGIQTQQTSATSYNSGIRIQGLDGRYTQILRDGLPLYSGFSAGLSIMQLTPLDLKQVEVIKGSSSTLYGGGAIAGLVNLVSKTPGEERELKFLANATSAKGLDLSAFYSERFRNVGFTFFTSSNTGTAYDPADIGLTAIPKFQRYTVYPRLFIYGKKSLMNVGLSYVTEKRLGGSLEYIKDRTPGYFEKNSTGRMTAHADYRLELNEKSSFQFKTSYSHFDRKITIPDYIFEGVQQSSYSELSYTLQAGKQFFIAGVNLFTDDLHEIKHGTNLSRDYHHNNVGVFAQHTWKAHEKITVETGIRTDYLKQYGWEILPRLSLLFRLTPRLTARLGGGFGYKTPTMFNEESESLHFRDIQPINEQAAKNERSVGTNLDLNYVRSLGKIGVSINQLFFYTRLSRPLILVAGTSGPEFINANGYLDTRGFETNLRLSYSDFKLFVGYTLSDVHSHFDNQKMNLPLTPKHRLNNVLMFEKEEKFRIGLEAYYTSRQLLSDQTYGKPYWVFGLMGEKIWKHFSIFINFENLSDTRQTRFESIFTGTINNPVFRDIYAPLDGFVVNGGVKISF